jgi:hypothetical protein
MARRKKYDDDQDNSPEENNDETFGLPEIEYQPLNRDENQPQQPEATTSQSTEPSSHSSYQTSSNEPQREEVQSDYVSTYDDDDEDSSPWPKIFGILAILALAGAAYWFFGIYQPRRKALADKAKQEQVAREADAKRAEAERAANAKRLAADQRRADSLANLNGAKAGEIETLTERTRRYYVVVASAVDGDLIMDHAKLLSAKGVSPKIIPPFGKAKFYRLAIAVGDNYKDTQATADGLKGDYGNDVWVIKY